MTAVMGEPCVHHWRIEDQNGTPLVAGECRKCGMTRAFAAAAPIVMGKTITIAPARRASARARAEQKRAETEARYAPRACKHCNTVFKPSRAGGFRAIFCSRACRYADHRRKRRATPGDTIEKNCLVCGAHMVLPYSGPNVRKNTCGSKDCKREMARRHAKALRDRQRALKNVTDSGSVKVTDRVVVGEDENA